jgi:hypothetical protein
MCPSASNCKRALGWNWRTVDCTDWFSSSNIAAGMDSHCMGRVVSRNVARYSSLYFPRRQFYSQLPLIFCVEIMSFFRHRKSSQEHSLSPTSLGGRRRSSAVSTSSAASAAEDEEEKPYGLKEWVQGEDSNVE